MANKIEERMTLLSELTLCQCQSVKNFPIVVQNKLSHHQASFQQMTKGAKEDDKYNLST